MKTRIWSALIAIYLAWGSTYLAIHYAVQSIPPFFMTGTRFLVAGLILYAWRRLAGDPAPSAAQWRSGITMGTLLLVGGIGGLSWAEQYLPSGISALMAAASPLWVVLIDALRPGGKRPSLVTMMGVLIGLAGIFILINPGKSTGGAPEYNILGLVVVLLGTLSWALGSIYSHTADLPDSAVLGTGIQLLAGSAGSFVVGLASGEGRQLNLASFSLSSIAGLAYLIVVGSLIGFVCFTWLLRVAPTTLVVTHAYVNPLVAVMLGSLLAQEVVTAKIFAAAPLILSAVVLIQVKKADKPGEEQVKERILSNVGEKAG